MNNAIFGKTMENAKQQKGEETMQYQKQIITLQNFLQKIYQQQK